MARVARRVPPDGRAATGAVPRLVNGRLSRAWGFDSLVLAASARSCHGRGIPARTGWPAGSRGSTWPSPARHRVAPPCRRAPRVPARRTPGRASSEAWPSGKAAPCYGVGALERVRRFEPCCLRPFRPVAQWMRAVGFEPTRARSSRAGASQHQRSTAGSSIAESASLTKRRLGVRVPRRGYRPLKLSSAEQPPCKRTAVGSIPTWGSSLPS